jgi:hypothetical protein
MSTATTTPAAQELEAELGGRWGQTLDRSSLGTTDDAIADALTVVEDALLGPYRVHVNSPTGESVVLGGEWMEDLEQAIKLAGQDAFEQYVVPAVIEAIVERLPAAPEWLAAHPESEQLRADLAALR